MNSWMAGAVIPGVPYVPGNLKIGWKALMRSASESDLWWNGSQWLALETDLAPYRTAAARIAADALLAPLHSPHFTGVPTTPDQVANVNAIIQLRDLFAATVLAGARASRETTSGALFPTLRITRYGAIRGEASD